MILTATSQGARGDHKEVAAARSILEKADKWDLLALETDSLPGKTKEARITFLALEWFFGWPRFHDWLIRGTIQITDADTRKNLLAALNKGIDEAEAKARKEREEGLLTSTGCFQPRHGIRATHDGKTVDFLICFKCTPIYIFADGKKHVIYTRPSPQDTFDRVLRDAKVSVAPRLLKDKK